MEPKTHKLKEPITVGSQTITELVIRKPQAGDIRSFPLMNPTAGDLLNVLGKLSGQPSIVIDQLGAEDVFELTGLVVDFLPAGLLTGLMR